LLQRKFAFILASAKGQAINFLSSRFSSDEPFLPNLPLNNHKVINLKHVLMKRIFVFFGLFAVLMVTVSSCASMKRDCQGRKHYRTANGIYV
jgi:hypothetical protein